MPNFTYCSLNIDGSKEDLEKFLQENRSEQEDLDFYKSAPLDQDIHAADVWGTKWNAIEPYAEFQSNGEDNETLHYHFQTAWDEPYGWFEIVAKKYPHLEFHIVFEDEAWLHCGEHEAFNGVVDYNKFSYGDKGFEIMYKNAEGEEEWENYVREREDG